MARLHVVLLALLPIILILTVLSEVESAVVKDGKEKGSENQESSKKVFVPASDALNFFKRRNRRSPKSHAEYIAEYRLQLANSERRREYYDEQNDEYENNMEENRNEQYERNRESIEQWREYHYDGHYPQYLYYNPYGHYPQYPYYNPY